jgi:hypothetical protein
MSPSSSQATLETPLDNTNPEDILLGVWANAILPSQFRAPYNPPTYLLTLFVQPIEVQRYDLERSL